MGMRWEEAVFALFDDLEMQAEGLHLDQRVGEVAALADAGYAEVVLASRVRASLGNALRIVLVDGTEMRGRLTRAGADWVLVDAGASEWLVPLRAVVLLDGAAESSTVPGLWPLVARLSIRAALRRISDAGGTCAVRLCGGLEVIGRVRRVGADFVELSTANASLVVPTDAIAAVRSEP